MLKFNLQQGFTLLELMLVLGLLAATCVALQQSLIHYYKLGWQVSQQLELRQTVRLLGQRITKEIKRANFLANSQLQSRLSYAYFRQNCLMIAYDYNRDGIIQNNSDSPELFAYRWKDQRIEYAIVNDVCQSGYWQSLTDPQQLEIIDFKLTQPAASRLKLEFCARLKKSPAISMHYIEWISVENGVW